VSAEAVIERVESALSADGQHRAHRS
jgi:hypothetical protein